MILDALKPIADIINKFIPDGAEKNRLQAELEKASLDVDKQRLGALSNMLGSNSFFVAGAIPSILWVLVISIINNYILMPWAATFGKTVPDVSLPGEVWNLAGWIVTGLLAKKAVDGNAFYSKTGQLIKPSRSDHKVNSLPPVALDKSPPSIEHTSHSIIIDDNEPLPNDDIVLEPDKEVTAEKDQDYYNRRFAELSSKFS